MHKTRQNFGITVMKDKDNSEKAMQTMKNSIKNGKKEGDI